MSAVLVLDLMVVVGKEQTCYLDPRSLKLRTESCRKEKIDNKIDFCTKMKTVVSSLKLLGTLLNVLRGFILMQ